MMSHDGAQGEKDKATYHVTVRNVTGHTTVGQGNRVVGGIGIQPDPAAPVTDGQLAALHAEFARVRELIEGLDGAGEREKGAAVDRLEELEEAVTDGEPDVRTMAKVRDWFAQRLPAALGAVTALLLHPTATLLAQAAGEEVASGFDGLLQSLGSTTSGENC
ncbi:hypothetical protein ACFXOS_24905 [Streptomyces sp. NPDC059175]|uniref:hypothetical protein n=1 Tax=Streptomyces sp. NPDC059175 TaxID=3346757 RepID=UPI00368E4BE9